MIILDKPYVSEFLKETIRKNNIPVLKNPTAVKMFRDSGFELIDAQDALKQIKTGVNGKIYSNSENAISWIKDNLADTELPEKIDLFKDKVSFRRLTQPLFKDYYFKEISISELEHLDISRIPKPFIIKPAVGFFSMVVYKISENKEWESVRRKITDEIRSVRSLYPAEVFNAEKLIIEQYIEGDEYAIDAYFDSDGEPVILNILKHLFASDEDVSDRVYISSKDIIEEKLQSFESFLRKVGDLAKLRNFPLHAEIRVDDNNNILPIEINPMRFGGWCTTADMTHFAYGFNPYLYYFHQKKPDWDNILKDKDGLVYSVIVLDNSSGIKEERIDSFDYRKLSSHFERPLEIRPVDFNEYPLFGFVFTETRMENLAELQRILQSDLREYLTLK
ncbi:MAG: ATP-grasp domain-containing protein [Gammaproteobacteria bacterium]|nr:MAG: ATP-grasp domain-containing protein [Gammaproteobacteria bacterium]